MPSCNDFPMHVCVSVLLFFIHCDSMNRRHTFVPCDAPMCGVCFVGIPAIARHYILPYNVAQPKKDKLFLISFFIIYLLFKCCFVA